MGRKISIRLEVDDSQGERAAAQLTNSFEEVDKAAQKAAASASSIGNNNPFAKLDAQALKTIQNLKSVNFGNYSQVTKDFETMLQDQEKAAAATLLYRKQLSAISTHLRDTSVNQDHYNKRISQLSPALQLAIKDANGLGRGINELGKETNIATSGLTSMLGSINPVALAAGALTVSITAATAAVIYGTKAAFDLAQQWAENGNEIGKFVEKTHLGAQASSALYAQLQRTGTSQEEFNDGIKNYIKLVGDANNGSEEARAKLARLRVDWKAAGKDFEGGFKSVLQTIMALPEGMAKTNAVMDAFGENGYKLLPFFTSFKGDVGALIKELDAFGVVMSEQDVKAAQELNRMLKDVQLQLRGLALTFGKEFGPDATYVLTSISLLFKDNKDEIKEWAYFTGNALRGTLDYLEKMASWTKENWWWIRAALAVSTTGASELASASYGGIGTGVGFLAEHGKSIARPMNNGTYDPTTGKMMGSGGSLSSDPYYIDQAAAKAASEAAKKRDKALLAAANKEKRDLNYMTWQELKKWFEDRGFTITSTTGGKHNTGSIHPKGLAVDVRTHDKSNSEIAWIMEEAKKAGIWIFDERTRPPGQKVWSGPHLHGQDMRIPRKGKGGASTLVSRQDNSFRQFDDDLYDREVIEKILKYYQNSQQPFPEKFAKQYADVFNKGVPKRNQLSVWDIQKRSAPPTPEPLQSANGQQVIEIPVRPKLLTPTEEFVKEFRESLGIQEIWNELEKAKRVLPELVTALVDADKASTFKSLLNTELELAALAKENADAEFVSQRRRLGAKQEELALQREITALQDQIANGAVNDALIIQAELLRDIISLRNRERDAIISINRSQLELSQSMVISNNQIRAKLFEHFAQQKTLNQAIADGMIQTYDTIAAKIDENIDKLFAWAGKAKGLFAWITEPLKAIAKQNLSNQFIKVVDFLFPGMGDKMAEAENPQLFHLKKHTELLKQIAKNTGGGIGAGGGNSLFGSAGGTSLSGLIGSVMGLGGGTGSVGAADGHAPQRSGGANAIDQAVQNAGQGSIFDRLKILFSTGEGGIFAPRHNVLNKDPKSVSKMGGILGGIGDLTAMAGGMIGGKWGNVLSMAGTGASIGSMFGPWGAAIGAGIGAIAGLFMGDPAKKRDKKENLPKLQAGFNDALQQLRQLLQDVRHLRVDPSSAISQADDLYRQIENGFGIQFESKKYRGIALQQIAQRKIEAKAIVDEIRGAADVSNAALERQRRILPEFATGVYMDRAFMQQYGDFKRRNGMLPGAFTGRDTLPSMLAPGEMVLNPKQIRSVISSAGFDPFQHAGIPGYADGTYAPSPSVPTSNAAPNFNSEISFEPHITIVVQGEIDAARIKEVSIDSLGSDDGKRKLKKAIVQLRSNKEIKS